jgi:hypothetical protein
VSALAAAIRRSLREGTVLDTSQGAELMLRWYWYLCGTVYAKQTALLRNHEAEDYESARSTLQTPSSPQVAQNPERFRAGDQDPKRDSLWK